MPELTVIEQPLLGRYAPAWDALVDQAPLPTPFLRSWWLEHTSCGRPVFVLVLDGEVLVGGIALQEERAVGRHAAAVHGQRPALPRSPRSPRRARPGARRRGCAAHRRWRRRDPAIVDLDGMRSDALVTGCFDKPTVILSTVAPYLALDGPGSLVGRPTRARWRKKHGLVHRVVAAEDADVALRTLRSLHEQRWGQESRFLPTIGRFESAAREGMRRGELLVHELVAPGGGDGDVVAVSVVLNVAGRASYYQVGRRTEPEWSGAGTAVLACSVAAAVDAGCHEFDFLRGAEPYKRDWSTGERSIYRLVADVGGRGARASVLAAAIVARQRSRPYVSMGRAFAERERRPGCTPCDDQVPGTIGDERIGNRSLRVVVAGGEAAGQRVMRGLAAAGHEVIAALRRVGADRRSRAGRGGPPRRPGAPCRAGEGSVGGGRARPDRPARQRAQPVRRSPPSCSTGRCSVPTTCIPGGCPTSPVATARVGPCGSASPNRASPSIAWWRRSTGVTLAFQDRFPAGAGATGGSVAVECAKRGIALVNRLVDALVAGNLELRQQDPAGVHLLRA